MFPQDLLKQAEKLLDDCKAAGLTLATAESCTGGLVIGCLTAVPGSSFVVDRGIVTYSNAAKRDLLNVHGDLLADFGAVSPEVARAMAEGALENSHADISVSITGIAGPGGGSPDKPVGLVYFGAARRGGAVIDEEHRFGDIGRDEVRLASVEVALRMLAKMI